MKSMKIYMYLIVGVIILIATAAILTQMLLNVSIPEVPQLQTGRKGPASNKITVSQETTIQLDQPEPTRDIEEGTWSRARKPAEKPQFTPPPATDAPGIGTISSIRGHAHIIRKDSKTAALQLNQRILTNDKINTAANSYIKITFDDGSIVSQGENASIIIDEFLYTPDDPEKNHFTMRIAKGVCRTVTGMITNLNPNRFKVKTRMATIGIRGCDLIFQSSRMKDDIYVLSLAGEKQVIIETTTNGSPLRDPVENDDFNIDKSIKKIISIETPNQMVSLNRRKTPEQREVSKAVARKMTAHASDIRPAKYELTQGKDSMVIDVKPTPNGNL